MGCGAGERNSSVALDDRLFQDSSIDACVRFLRIFSAFIIP
jgi:hypothetical protein